MRALRKIAQKALQRLNRVSVAGGFEAALFQFREGAFGLRFGGAGIGGDERAQRCGVVAVDLIERS